MATIPIENPSFEQGAAGWEFSGASGARPVDNVPCAYIGNGGSFSQTLKATAAEVQGVPNKTGATDGVYTLSFSVKDFFAAYPGYWTAEVTYGTQYLCEVSGWGKSDFTQVTLVIPGPTYIVIYKALGEDGSSSMPVQGTKPFTIKFSVAGWTVLFKDISLIFTPSS